jgi:hypothetical protein
MGGGQQGSSGFAVASLVLGILSIPGCALYGVPSLILGGLAIIFAMKATKQVRAGLVPASARGMAVGGQVCGIIGVSLGGLYLLFLVGMLVLAISAGGGWP